MCGVIRSNWARMSGKRKFSLRNSPRRDGPLPEDSSVPRCPASLIRRSRHLLACPSFIIGDIIVYAQHGWAVEHSRDGNYTDAISLTGTWAE